MTFLWILSASALLVAAAALYRARRVSKRLEKLTESYWELRYENGQLRARVARLEPPDAAPAGGEPGPPPARGQQTQFVPLSSLKR